MKRVSPYLKMRVLGAIEYAPGTTIVARIRHVAEQPFTDDNGVRFQFTWRTIQTWYSRSSSRTPTPLSTPLRVHYTSVASGRPYTSTTARFTASRSISRSSR